MSKNLYRVCKKSDLDEIIKNNFFKPICIIFTTKEVEKEFEDNIANLFKTLSKQNTYSMHLLINLDNFIDNINFFAEMRNNSPNFIAYFKGKQLSSFSNTQNNKDLFLSSTKDIINKINSSYIQKLVVSFNQEDSKTNKEDSKNNKEDYKANKEELKSNKEKNKTKKNEDNDKEDDDNKEDNNDEDDNDSNDSNESDDDKNTKNDKNDKDNEDEKTFNNIKKRNIESISEKVDLNKVDLNKVDLSKVDLSKVDLKKVDLKKVDLDQLSIDKKKEKLKALLELKKQVQKN